MKIMKNYELKVFLDLDGVLADFSGRLKEITGKPAESLSKGYLWASVQKYNDNVAPFFETLDKMPDADQLFNFVTGNFGHVGILTATGWTPRDGADQKRNWVKKHFGDKLDVKVVTSGSLKKEFATPQTVLVDDTTKAITPWIQAGGIGVLHRNAKQSIEELKQILSRHPQVL